MAQFQCGRKWKDRFGRERAHGCLFKRDEPWEEACPECGGWYVCVPVGRIGDASASLAALVAKTSEAKRLATGIAEVDRVLNGGLVRGSSLYITGEAGAGKTTLLMSVANYVAEKTERHVIYASGEQSDGAIGLVAKRVSATSERVIPMGGVENVNQILDVAEDQKAILVVVDSVQTAFVEDCEAKVGSTEQVKAVANFVTSYATQKDVVIVLIGHRTADGRDAGPENMRHLVDVLTRIDKAGLGDLPPIDEKDHDGVDPEEELKMLKGLRVFSCSKNRFGPEDVEAFLEMAEDGSGLRTPSKRRSKYLKLVT